MRSDLADDKNSLQIVAAEIAESSDTSGFYDITNGTNLLPNEQLSTNQLRTARPKRTTRRMQTVNIECLISY